MQRPFNAITFALNNIAFKTLARLDSVKIKSFKDRRDVSPWLKAFKLGRHPSSLPFLPKQVTLMDNIVINSIVIISIIIIIIITRPRPAFGRLGLGGSSEGYSSHGKTSHASLRAYGAQLGGE